ncbi:MAG: ribonuclease H-like domain-containing protein [Deltaproteobacteria bacterium]|jgi:uncharacterized protein YprB with RNaseH-like and TPR domain|nr:ribonuclease H-like domain-containing protein [Deltaproteobacteria bacterium]
MLKSTFAHILGISLQKEQKLWSQGVLTWDDLFASSHSPSAPNWLRDSQKAFKAGDLDYFASALPNSEHWRLAASYPKEAMFVDIETTGLSTDYHAITIIGWSLGGNFKILVNGRDDPDDFLNDLAKTKTLVTFNGRSFDARFLTRLFGPGVFPKAHADLRHLCQRLGWAGGQKKIERDLGLTRQTPVLDGSDAVILWNNYVFGSKPAKQRSALRELIVYNHADVEGMKTIFEACLESLAKTTPNVKTGIFAALATNPDFSSSSQFPFSLRLLDE